MLNTSEIQRLEAKIAAVENLTSAEFKIIICAHAWLGLKRKAHKLFQKYKLDTTKERNGVLILIAEKDREFLIYGDQGIHEKVGEEFWLNIKEDMLEHFKQGDIASGLSLGLHLLADMLAEHFPKQDDENELCNSIVFEK